MTLVTKNMEVKLVLAASVYPELIVGGVVDPLLEIEADMQRFLSLCTSVTTQHSQIYDIIYNI